MLRNPTIKILFSRGGAVSEEQVAHWKGFYDAAQREKLVQKCLIFFRA